MGSSEQSYEPVANPDLYRHVRYEFGNPFFKGHDSRFGTMVAQQMWQQGVPLGRGESGYVVCFKEVSQFGYWRSSDHQQTHGETQQINRDSSIEEAAEFLAGEIIKSKVRDFLESL